MSCRYRLQRKTPVSLPCRIGNVSRPLPTYQWQDVAISDDLEALKEYGSNCKSEYRIEDTEYSDERFRFIRL